MDEAKTVYRLDGKHAFCHVKPGHVLRECVVLYEHGHEVATGKEFHDEVQVCGVLKGVVQLDYPRRV